MFSEFCSISALSCSFEFVVVVVVVVVVGGCSQRLLCLNPTTVMVVLLLGCDNISKNFHLDNITNKWTILQMVCTQTLNAHLYVIWCDISLKIPIYISNEHMLVTLGVDLMCTNLEMSLQYIVSTRGTVQKIQMILLILFVNLSKLINDWKTNINWNTILN